MKTLNNDGYWTYRFPVVQPTHEQLPYQIKNGSLLLKIKVFPKSERNAIGEVRNGELVVRIRAPALRGKANKELEKYVAKRLALPRPEIRILSGDTSRHKLISLPLTAERALEELL
jgi:uncharacterized protein (TIGR00251 family)